MKTKNKNIEDIYPLSPMQQGILFHSISASNLYVQQESYELKGNLDVAIFEQAWQSAIARHSVLRTAFVWENVAQPIQIVGKQVKLPLEKYDWRGLSLQQQQQQLEVLLEQDRQRELKLSQAPLMRLILIQIAEKTHYLIWSHHHLILDGWSLSLLMQEVFTAYESLHTGQTLSLKSPRPYKDYITWLQQRDKEDAKQFWQKYLQGFQASTPFGLDRIPEDKNKQTDNYAEAQIQITTATTTRLQLLARQHKITLNILLQGVWALLLSCYSGEKDVVFGSTSSGRPPSLIGSESTLGVFINTLPMRVQVKPEQLVIPWLKQLQSQQIKLLQYDYTPLIEIQSGSEVAKGLPLFESIFISQDYNVGSALPEGMSDLQIRNFSSADSETNYPLTILVEARSELNIIIGYDGQRFAAEAIARILQHFQNLLVEIGNNPHRQLKDLPILTPAERHQLLVEWNNTQVEYPIDKCIHQLFEQQVAQTPDAIAVVFEQQQLTYRELNQQANQLARLLLDLGVKPGEFIAIYQQRNLKFLIAILAVLKAGGVYLPIDNTYPSERISYMLSNSQVRFLLTDSTHTNILLNFFQSDSDLNYLICLDSQPAAITDKTELTICNPSDFQDLSIANLNINLSGIAPAYLMYTSGSTGVPKGAIIRHGGAINHIYAQFDALNLSPSLTFLQSAPASSDISIWQFLAPLLIGGKTVIVNTETVCNPEQLVQVIQQTNMTLVELVPVVLRALLDYLSSLSTEKRSLPNLQWMIVTGEAVAVDLVNDWLKLYPSIPVVNAYGPTEAADDITQDIIEEPLPTTQLSVPIGKPLANLNLYILDRHLQLLPIGVPGEICVSGYGVGVGYWRNEEKTKASFVPNPFLEGRRQEAEGRRESYLQLNPTSHSLIYKTGDLGRWLPDGRIEYLGRIDNQVKIRGFRLELGEIEAVIAQHPEIKEVVVIAREDTPGKKQLVAYLVASQSLKLKQLRTWLGQKLPDHMIPSVWMELDKLPLTPNGKIDRKSLPIPNSPLITETAYSEAITPVEKQLVSIWQEVLGVSRVGINDNFFELGGDSIISLQLIFKASQVGLRLTPKQLFQDPTIAQLAMVVNKIESITAEQGLVTGTFPLIPIQQWFFDENFANPHHWNQAVMLNVPSDISADILQKAIAQLIAHHDLLRTQFKQIESQWQPYITAERNLEYFTQLDFSHRAQEQVKSTIEETADDIQASLNLSTGQIFRAVLFNLGSHRTSRLLIVIHHLVVDGVSWRILLEDLQNIYNSLKNSQVPQLPAKTTSFSQWTERLVSYASSPQLRSELDYWLTTLQQPITPLPLDYPEGNNSEASTRMVSVTLNAEETAALLTEVPATYQTQINDVLLTALVQSFTQWMGGQTILFELEGHGREALFEDIDLSRTVGWFTSIFPVMLNLGDLVHPGEALKSIKEQLRAIPNRGIGYGILRYLSREAEIIKSLSSLPQTEISFNYLGQFEGVLTEVSAFTSASESSGNEQSLQNHRTLVLEIDSMIVSDCLQINWTYSQNLHRQATIESLAQSYLTNLRALILHCQSPDAGGFTPSDFAEFKQSQWNQDDLEAITAAIRGM